jgi:hypothetical protein
MCPERLPEPANAGPLAGGRRASLARIGRAHDPTKWSCAQQVKLVLCRYCARSLGHGGLSDPGTNAPAKLGFSGRFNENTIYRRLFVT